MRNVGREDRRQGPPSNQGPPPESSQAWLQHTLNEVSRTLGRLEGDVSGLGGQIDTVGSRIDSLSKKVDTLQRQSWVAIGALAVIAAIFAWAASLLSSLTVTLARDYAARNAPAPPPVVAPARQP